MADRSLTTLVLGVLCLMLTATSLCHGQAARSCSHIHAAVSIPSQLGAPIFFNHDEYLRYSHIHQAEEEVWQLRTVGLHATIQAAFTDQDNRIVILTRNTFHRYKVSEKTVLTAVDSGNITDLGLPSDVDAAVRWNMQTFVFKGCEVWTYNADTRQRTYLGFVSDLVLGLPCDIDAAVEWLDDSALFIKGHSYWIWSPSGTLDGPRHTDDLNICSWYLCGEADWMRERMSSAQVTACNGDIRLCPLRLNQVTLPGLHNAGAGFAGDLGWFGFFNCWLKNHGMSITKQLENGIRHLDIDPCYDTCGLLGSCHSFLCGGSICRILKQTRLFMKENRQEVITINFNHEIVDKNKVFKALTRQIKTQLGPVVNEGWRNGHVWPTLRDSIMTNRRLFVIYAPDIQESPFDRLYYNPNKWIHSENLYRSTWTVFHPSAGCQPLVELTKDGCVNNQNASLLEVSVATSFELFSCLDCQAAKCLPFQHDLLLACEAARFQHNTSPNVLLVDWPENNLDDASSVFNAVRQQNVRNILRHRQGSCHVWIDSALRLADTSRVMFWSGREAITYDMVSDQETSRLSLWPDLSNSSASYLHHVTGRLVVFAGCERREFHPRLLQLSDGQEDVTSHYLLNSTTLTDLCPVDAAVVLDGRPHLFTGCQIQVDGRGTFPVSQWGFPCFVDAAFAYDATLYVFKGDKYFKRSGNSTTSGKILAWNIDLVQC